MTNIKPVLSLVDVNMIVNSVVNACFVDGEYRPENKISAEKLSKIIVCTDYFSDSDVNDFSLETFYEKFFIDDEIIMLVKDIDKTLSSNGQNNEIKTAINEAIEYKKNILYKASAYSETDMALSSLIVKLEEIISTLGENISKEDVDKAIKFVMSYFNGKDNSIVNNVIDSLISKKIIGKEYKEANKPIKTK